MKIKSIQRKILNSEKKFYDITVDKYHNFIIGKESMIVTHNSSLSNAIINMTQDFKNNVPLFDQDGQFGSLRSPDAGAPRYIGTKLNENFKLLYKDTELLENQIEEGEKIEPKFYLPIIPMILINGGSGIAVGFSSNILNRDITDVINACIDSLNRKKIKPLKPHLNKFTGEFIQDETNQKKWIIMGKYEKVNTTTIRITELPPAITYEKYEEHLDKLINSKHITSYEDNCKDNIDYTIKMSRKQLSELTDEDIIKMFKLQDTTTEIYNTLDERGKLLQFENTQDMIKYFVDFRLKWYDTRKSNEIEKLKRIMTIDDMKMKFIELILEKKLTINNTKRQEIEKKLNKFKITQIDDSFDYLFRMPLSSLTKEKYEELKNKISVNNEKLKEIEKLTPKEMYLNELHELKKIWSK